MTSTSEIYCSTEKGSAGPAQTLVSIKVNLELMEALMPNAPEPVTSAMRRLQLLTEQAFSEIRSISQGLHPPDCRFAVRSRIYQSAKSRGRRYRVSRPYWRRRHCDRIIPISDRDNRMQFDILRYNVGEADDSPDLPCTIDPSFISG